jgi:hypothetical protein
VRQIKVPRRARERRARRRLVDDECHDAVCARSQRGGHGSLRVPPRSSLVPSPRSPPPAAGGGYSARSAQTSRAQRATRVRSEPQAGWRGAETNHRSLHSLHTVNRLQSYHFTPTIDRYITHTLQR